MPTNNSPHVVDEIGFSNLDNSLFATVIYISGIKVFDEVLEGNKFSETNVLMSLITTIDSIYFVLLTNDSENVLARLEVKRNNILDYTQSDEKTVEVPNFSRFKAVLPGMFGIRGVQIGKIAKGMKKEKLFKIIGSKQAKGYVFKLKYAEGEKEKIIELSSYDIHKSTLSQFLEFYWNTRELVVNENSSSGGCYIATACYQNQNCNELKILYRFRDEILLKNSIGRIFTKNYYKYSPKIAKYLSKADFTNWLVRVIILNPIVTLVKFLLR